jgi:hypothetical protein
MQAYTQARESGFQRNCSITTSASRRHGLLVVCANSALLLEGPYCGESQVLLALVASVTMGFSRTNKPSLNALKDDTIAYRTHHWLWWQSRLAVLLLCACLGRPYEGRYRGTSRHLLAVPVLANYTLLRYARTKHGARKCDIVAH